MRNRIQYFSTYDMSISYYLQNAEEIIERYHKGWRPEDVNDVIELYNIWLFVDNGIYMKSWSEDMLNEIRGYKDNVIPFFSNLDETTWVTVYKQIDFSYRDDFWEIIDRFNIKSFVNKATLEEAFSENSNDLRYLLQRERLVRKYDKIVASMLKDNEHTAEWILSEFVEDDKFGSHEHIYFPASLTLQEREDIISKYLDLPEPNLNYVRLILVAKRDSNLRLSDDVIDMMANSLNGDIRQLLSCLHSLLLKSKVQSQFPNIAMAREIIAQYEQTMPFIDIDSITKCVCEAFGIEPEILRSRSRKNNYVLARGIIFYLARMHTDLSLASIGQTFGRKHSTVLKGISNVEHEMNKETTTGRQISSLISRIEARAR